MSQFDRQRNWVNENFGNLTRGISMKKKQKSKLLKRLWNKAKKEIK